MNSHIRMGASLLLATLSFQAAALDFASNVRYTIDEITVDTPSSSGDPWGWSDPWANRGPQGVVSWDIWGGRVGSLSVNNSGQVAGALHLGSVMSGSAQVQPFVWGQSSGFQALQLPVDRSSPYGWLTPGHVSGMDVMTINNAGQVAGVVRFSYPGVTSAFQDTYQSATVIWQSPTASATFLSPTVSGTSRYADSSSTLVDLSDSGRVVGYETINASFYRWYYPGSEEYVDYPARVNERRGWASDSAQALSDDALNLAISAATDDVNLRGDRLSLDAQGVFVQTADGRRLSVSDAGTGVGISAGGTVVARGASGGIIWHEGVGSMPLADAVLPGDPNAGLARRLNPFGISDAGDIFLADPFNFNESFYVMRPMAIQSAVPEPDMVALLAAGLAVCVGLARRARA